MIMRTIFIEIQYFEVTLLLLLEEIVDFEALFEVRIQLIFLNFSFTYLIPCSSSRIFKLKNQKGITLRHHISIFKSSAADFQLYFFKQLIDHCTDFEYIFSFFVTQKLIFIKLSFLLSPKRNSSWLLKGR